MENIDEWFVYNSGKTNLDEFQFIAPPLPPPLQNWRFYEMTGTCLPVDSQFFLVMVLCFVFLIFCMMVHKCEI